MMDPKYCWNNDHELYEDTLITTGTSQTLIYCTTCKKIMIFYFHDDKIVWVIEMPSNTPHIEISKLLDWGDDE